MCWESVAVAASRPQGSGSLTLPSRWSLRPTSGERLGPVILLDYDSREGSSLSQKLSHYFT